MGIPGLWASLSSAAHTTTLPGYTLRTLCDNANALRGLRLGIDASLWLFHAQQSAGGSNPVLRLLFYRLAKLLALPVLVLFVFDGPDRPVWKRGKQVQARQHAVEAPFAQLIEAFGFRWMRAPGEAEAQLAALSREAKLDAVLTDDVDALLFGATVVVRNWGKNLSGTKALARTSSNPDADLEPTQDAQAATEGLAGSDRDHQITLYRSADLKAMDVDRDGLILIALMSGGDYDTRGLVQCGVKIALALAQAGFATPLVRAFRAAFPTAASTSRASSAFGAFLATWLESVRQELRTNASGRLPSRRPKLATTLEGFLATAEARRVMAYYVYPLTTAHELDWGSATPDLARLAALAQADFRWSPQAVLAKFKTIVAPGWVARRLREEMLLRGEGAEGPWGALVESPASKAVRRHQLGLSTSQSQPAVKAGRGREREKPLWESPNATRITDFFASSLTSSTPRKHESRDDHATRKDASTANEVREVGGVGIVSVKMVRRHAALAPYEDYRTLVRLDELVRETQAGIVALDSTTASDSDSDKVQEQGEEGEQGGLGEEGDEGVCEPVWMWIAAPLLELSVSGHSALAAFQHKAKAVSKSKSKSKTKTKGKEGKEGREVGQTTLTSFVQVKAKPSQRIVKTLKLPSTVVAASARRVLQLPAPHSPPRNPPNPTPTTAATSPMPMATYDSSVEFVRATHAAPICLLDSDSD